MTSEVHLPFALKTMADGGALSSVPQRPIFLSRHQRMLARPICDDEMPLASASIIIGGDKLPSSAGEGVTGGQW